MPESRLARTRAAYLENRDRPGRLEWSKVRLDTYWCEVCQRRELVYRYPWQTELHCMHCSARVREVGSTYKAQ